MKTWRIKHCASDVQHVCMLQGEQITNMITDRIMEKEIREEEKRDRERKKEMRSRIYRHNIILLTNVCCPTVIKKFCFCM